MAPVPSGDVAAATASSSRVHPVAAGKEKKSKKQQKAGKSKEKEAPTTPAAVATAAMPHADSSAPSAGKRSVSNPVDELDDLFSTIKKRKAEDTAAAEKKEKKEAEASKKQQQQLDQPAVPPAGASKDDLFGEGASLTFKRKRDPVSGLPLYSEEELRIGGGGGTRDCPFDCDCCY